MTPSRSAAYAVLGQAVRRAIMGNEGISLASTLICPFCGSSTQEQMPEDRCVIVYPCPHCGKIIRPRKGDCCVFCSYGTVRCPPEQSRMPR